MIVSCPVMKVVSQASSCGLNDDDDWCPVDCHEVVLPNIKTLHFPLDDKVRHNVLLERAAVISTVFHV